MFSVPVVSLPNYVSRKPQRSVIPCSDHVNPRLLAQIFENLTFSIYIYFFFTLNGSITSSDGVFFGAEGRGCSIQSE